ncbi:hypothetical protein [Tepidiforma sp.]|uniref:hypothetical protein n=1 Tax=Tepidiforma sp. TaxID=2682230 RepID=UPI00262CB078|nr:hypothetical protein [Tepidiforma sp.]MCX7617780.1 hypothetical protein [Tepidiforma sp.]
MKAARTGMRRSSWFPAAWIVAAAAVAAALILTGCGGNGGNGGDGGSGPAGPGPAVERQEPAGEPRSLLLGFSSLPPELTSEAYIQAFATAAQYADLILIQRTPPWADFLPGGNISQETAETTRLETALLKQYSDLKLYFAIDPTDGAVQRSRLANLPPSVDVQAGFTDPGVRAAFVAYAAYVAKNYRPAYMALGVEVNMIYERAPEQFEAFVSLYQEAYAVVKGNSPETKVFPTWQLEDLEGTFGQVHPPRWELLERFRGKMDVLAISTYPFLGEVRSVADIREDYYRQLRARWDGEILIAETGYPSAPVEGREAVGTEAEQRAYLQRLLTEAEQLGFTGVVWFAALDPAFATTGPAVAFRDIGLRRADGSNKQAWPLWEEWARRPLAAGK